MFSIFLSIFFRLGNSAADEVNFFFLTSFWSFPFQSVHDYTALDLAFGSPVVDANFLRFPTGLHLIVCERVVRSILFIFHCFGISTVDKVNFFWFPTEASLYKQWWPFAGGLQSGVHSSVNPIICKRGLVPIQKFKGYNLNPPEQHYAMIL